MSSAKYNINNNEVGEDLPEKDQASAATGESAEIAEPAAPALPCFPSLLNVVSHLDMAGFKISKSKLYRDKDKNLIRVNPDGTVLETEVRAYASTLERKEAGLDDLNDIHIVKTTREVEKINEQIARLKFERQKEQGKYLPRKDFEIELAARAAVFETGFRYAFNLHAREWIALVNGKAEKTADLLQHMNKILDEQLTEYASLKTFQVLFEGFELDEVEKN